MGGAAPVADLQFRRAVPADADAMARLLSDEAVFGGLLQLPYPTPELWRKRLETQAVEQDALHLVALAGDTLIASGGLHPVGPSLRRRHVAGLGMCVAAGWQRRGVGSGMMRRLLDWADHWIGYLRIELGVYTDNAAAIALYRRFGFEVEGTQRAYALRGGRYVDTLMMARLHPNPPQLPPTRP